MATMRFTCLLLVLLFISWHHIAHAHQDGREDAELHAVSTGKGLFDGQRVPTVAINKRILGRKMIINNLMRLEKMNGHDALVGTSNMAGSNQFVGRCDKKVIGVSNVKCKQDVSYFPKEFDEAGFVAFNADYHEPRHHPPKNN